MKGKFKKSQFTHRWTQQLKRTEEIRGRQTCFVLAHTIKAIPVPRKKSRLAGYEANNTPLLWTLFLKVQIFLPLGFLIFKSGNVMKKKQTKNTVTTIGCYCPQNVFISGISQEEFLRKKVAAVQWIHSLFIQVGSCCLWQSMEGISLTLVVMTSGSFQYFTGGGSSRMGSGNFFFPVIIGKMKYTMFQQFR